MAPPLDGDDWRLLAYQTAVNGYIEEAGLIRDIEAGCDCVVYCNADGRNLPINERLFPLCGPVHGDAIVVRETLGGDPLPMTIADMLRMCEERM